MEKKRFIGKEAIAATVRSSIYRIRSKIVPVNQWFFLPLFYASIVTASIFFVCALFLHHRSESISLDVIEEQVDEIEQLAFKMASEKQRREAFRQLYGRADPNYLTQHIESLIPLRSEVNLLKTIRQMPAFGTFEPLKRRLDFLTKGQNQLLFEEVDRRKRDDFLEVESRLIHPITIDLDDLTHLLSLVEGVEIGEYTPSVHRPQTFFRFFEIKRERISDSRESYVMNMELLTRELR